MFIYSAPKSNFTILPNEVIDSETLSLTALAIYVKLRRNKETWNLNVKAFAKKIGLSLNTFYKYMKELYKAGLIKRVQGRDADGNWNKEVAYIFTDSDELLDTEIELNKLEKQQIKQLENDLKARFEKETEDSLCANKNEVAESQNLEIEKFVKLNNTNVNNKTKKDVRAPKQKNVFALVDLQNLWLSCKKALENEKSKRELNKQREASELFSFKQHLTASEEKAYDDYIAYRSEKKKLSKHTLKRIQNKFLQLKRDGQNLSEVVENSILKAWIDLYPVQTKQKAQHEAKVKQSKQYKSFRERYKDFDYEAEMAKIMAYNG